MIRTSLVVAIYAIAIGVGCDLRFRFPNREDMHYVLFRDLVPLVIAIPAAWLAYSIQRRQGFLRQLGAASAEASLAAQAAIRHTRKARPTRDETAVVLAELGVAIDGARGVFRGLGREAMPFGDLEAIRDEVAALGFEDDWDPSRADAARPAIEARWDQARGLLFEEFDRTAPAPPRRRADAAAVRPRFPARGPVRADQPSPAVRRG